LILTGKKITILTAVILLIGVCVAAISAYAGSDTAKGESMAKKTRIILIGASVGQDWNLQEFTRRTNNDDYVFESVAAWQYDKTDALEEVLMRPRRKFHPTKSYLKGFFKPSPAPVDVVILKECAAYFPGDMVRYKELMKKWVGMIRDTKKEVLLATVAPVTETRAAKQKGKIEAILEYNDWIRQYAKDENITVIDLEAALRKGPETRFLKDELTSGDGTHLNRKAYDILDVLLKDTCQARLKNS
jgi:hypothetical protein